MTLTLGCFQPENQPTLRLGFASNNNHIAVGGPAVVTVAVTPKPGAVYRDMQVVLRLPVEGSTAVLSMCRVTVEVGPVLPCVDADKLTELVQLSSSM